MLLPSLLISLHKSQWVFGACTGSTFVSCKSFTTPFIYSDSTLANDYKSVNEALEHCESSCVMAGCSCESVEKSPDDDLVSEDTTREWELVCSGPPLPCSLFVVFDQDTCESTGGCDWSDSEKEKSVSSLTFSDIDDDDLDIEKLESGAGQAAARDLQFDEEKSWVSYTLPPAGRGSKLATPTSTVTVSYTLPPAGRGAALLMPTNAPSSPPTAKPTATPTSNPTRRPTPSPTPRPTNTPTRSPTRRPTPEPSAAPSQGCWLCDPGDPTTVVKEFAFPNGDVGNCWTEDIFFWDKDATCNGMNFSGDKLMYQIWCECPGYSANCDFCTMAGWWGRAAFPNLLVDWSGDGVTMRTCLQIEAMFSVLSYGMCSEYQSQEHIRNLGIECGCDIF